MRREIKALAMLAIPIVITASIDYFGVLCTTIFAGQLLSTELFDAVCLGTTMTNISGYSTIIAFASPMDSLCSQANGARNWKLYSLTVWRALLCSSILLIPIVVLWVNMDNLLEACGYNTTIAYNTYLWCLVYLAILPAYVMRTVSMRFLVSQGIFQPLLPVSILCYVLWHPLFLYIVFIAVGNTEFIMFPVVNVVSTYLQTFLMVSYIVMNKPHHPESFQLESVSEILQWQTDWVDEVDAHSDLDDDFAEGQAGGINKNVVDKGLSEYLQLLFAGIFSMCGEWWSWELMTIIVGLLGATQLAVDVIYSTIIPLYYMLPLGMGMAGAARVGALVGENRYGMAKRVGNATLWFTLCWAVLLAVLSFALREYLPKIFTSNPSVIDVAVNLSPLFCAFVIPHQLQGSFQGVLRGIKRQGDSALAVLIGPWLISIPLACLLAFYPTIRWEIYGMWAGNNVGYYVMDAIFLYLWLSFEWSAYEEMGHGPGSVLIHSDSEPKSLIEEPDEYKSLLAHVSDH